MRYNILEETHEQHAQPVRAANPRETRLADAGVMRKTDVKP